MNEENAVSSSTAFGAKPTSIEVFRRFLHTKSDGCVDASAVFSRACYEAWLESRKSKDLRDPERQFQRSISSHVTALDGRVPFTEQEEMALLSEMRKKRIWPCFQGGDKALGLRGYTALGYHEKRRMGITPPANLARQQQDLILNRKRKSQAEAAAAAVRQSTDVPMTTRPEWVPPFLNYANPPSTLLAANPNQPRTISANHSSGGNSEFIEIYTELASHVEPNHLVQILHGMSLVEHLPHEERWPAMFKNTVEVIGPRKTPPPERNLVELQAWIDAMSLEDPDEIIFSGDTAAIAYETRYLCQNSASLRILGPITNTASSVYRPDQLIIVVLAFGATYSNRGQDFSAPVYFQCVDGQSRLFQTRFHVEPSKLVTLVRAKLI